MKQLGLGWSKYRNPGWGQPWKTICWLVGPSSYDVEHMPEHFTLEYQLISMEMSRHPNIPMVIARSIDREEIAEKSKELWSRSIVHGVRTVWYDTEGKVVNKVKYVQEHKEAANEARI